MSNTMSARDFDELAGGRSDWGWWVAFGALLILSGLIALANLAMATRASVLVVGVMMIVGGIAQIALAFPARAQWGRFFLWLALGLLYIAAGIVTFQNPVLAKLVLTLFLAASLIVGGIVRIAGGLGLKSLPGWGWVVASGVLTLIVGLVIAARWPVNSFWVLGLFLGADLVVAGIAYSSYGLALRARR